MNILVVNGSPKMTEGMLMPYTKVLKKLDTEKK